MRTIRQLIEGLVLLGIESERLNFYAADIDQIVAVFRNFIVKERNMLEEVGIRITIIDGAVRCVIIFRLNDVELNVVLLKQNRCRRI